MAVIFFFEELDSQALYISLRVNIIQKWTMRNEMFGYNCQMILMDANVSIGHIYNKPIIYIIIFLLIILFFLIGHMIKVTLKNSLMHKFYCMLNKHCWVRLSNFKIIHSTGIIRVTRHKYEILFAATTCVEFIFPEETIEIFSFVKYNELNMRLIHSKFSFSWKFILLLCLFNFIMLRTNCSSTRY